MTQPIIRSEKLLLLLALDCIYSCECRDQLTTAFAILECLPQRTFGVTSAEMMSLHNRVDDLECHLSSAELLEKHNLSQTIEFVRTAQVCDVIAFCILLLHLVNLTLPGIFLVGGRRRDGEAVHEVDSSGRSSRSSLRRRRLATTSRRYSVAPRERLQVAPENRLLPSNQDRF